MITLGYLSLFDFRYVNAENRILFLILHYTCHFSLFCFITLFFDRVSLVKMLIFLFHSMSISQLFAIVAFIGVFVESDRSLSCWDHLRPAARLWCAWLSHVCNSVFSRVPTSVRHVHCYLTYICKRHCRVICLCCVYVIGWCWEHFRFCTSDCRYRVCWHGRQLQCCWYWKQL